MPENEGLKPDGSVRIPGWAWKAAIGVVQGVMMGALSATIAWAWNTETRVSELEHTESVLQADLATAEAKLESVSQNHLEITVLKTELSYIKDGIADIKTLLTDR